MKVRTSELKNREFIQLPNVVENEDGTKTTRDYNFVRQENGFNVGYNVYHAVMTSSYLVDFMKENDAFILAHKNDPSNKKTFFIGTVEYRAVRIENTNRFNVYRYTPVDRWPTHETIEAARYHRNLTDVERKLRSSGITGGYKGHGSSKRRASRN